MSFPYVIICLLSVLLAAGAAYRLFLALQKGEKRYETGACKTIGSREIQMDYFAVEENENGLLAVLADGMGKEAGGRIAAKTVVRVFQEVFREYNILDHPSYFFRKAFQTANHEILKQLEEGRGMASASAVMIQGEFLYYALVGNVKVAVFRNQELIPLGTGHTVDVLAEDKYYQGVLTREDALAMLHEKRIYNFLGRDGFREINFYDRPARLKQEDIVAVFSNGMHESIAWKYMEERLSQKKNCRQIALDLVEAVNQKEGDKENASVILIRIGELT